MPTALPPDEKAAYIALVAAAPFPNMAYEAARLADILNNYEDVYTAICRQIGNFNANNGYLKAALEAFDSTALEAVGIYLSYNGTPPLVDPVLIANSIVAGEVQLSTSGAREGIVIMNSSVTKVTIAEDVSLTGFYIGQGSAVDVLDGTATNASINTLWLESANINPGAALNRVLLGSVINRIELSDGSYFGGFANSDPQATCVNPVQGVSFSNITSDSATLTWSLPNDSFTAINVYYRQYQKLSWLPVMADTGNYISNTGFVFRYLEEDTKYEFRIDVVCPNGGVNATETIAKTPCCGDGAESDSIPIVQKVSKAGDLTISVEAGRELHSIDIAPDSTETIRIGTTPGGDEVMIDQTITDPLTYVIDKTYSLTIPTSIYISGAVGSVTYRIIKL